VDDDVCDNLNWMKNGWMDWIEWMWMWKVESGLSGCGKWKVARFRISHIHTAFHAAR